MFHLKETLKKEAKDLREYKDRLKEAQRTGKHETMELNQWELRKKKSTWRHKHIAYCILKGRTIDEIEPKVREGNRHNQRVLDQYITEFKLAGETNEN